jgi:Leucine-rich repeat (LRR) protein
MLGLRSILHIDRIGAHLEKLNLSQNDLVDIRPLGGLTTLRELNLCENNM